MRFHYVLIDFLCGVDRGAGKQAVRASTDASDAQWASLAGLRESPRFLLPGWTMDVVEEAWRQAVLSPEIFGS